MKDNCTHTTYRWTAHAGLSDMMPIEHCEIYSTLVLVSDCAVCENCGEVMNKSVLETA